VKSHPRHAAVLLGLARYAVLGVLFVFSIFPFIWIWLTALKQPSDLMENIFGLPSSVNWQNFVQAWVNGHFGLYIRNSLIITAPAVAGVCLVSALAGYAFAKLKFIGRDVLFFLFLLGLMIPFQAIMVSLYFELRTLHMLTTYWAAIFPMTALGLPLGIFIMRAFFKGLPNELADAALIDGCNQLNVFWRVMLPCAYPALSSVLVFQALQSWNDFLIPLLYLQREEVRPLTVGLMLFKSRYTINYPVLAAGATIVTLPLLVLYVVFQRQFVTGLTSGALKG
jgi:raffinose/stachyose/melibiose transport system permease protein